jgi:hypothetical protein
VGSSARAGGIEPELADFAKPCLPELSLLSLSLQKPEDRRSDKQDIILSRLPVESTEPLYELYELLPELLLSD